MLFKHTVVIDNFGLEDLGVFMDPRELKGHVGVNDLLGTARLGQILTADHLQIYNDID